MAEVVEPQDIYCNLPKKEIPTQKLKRYVSIYRPTVVAEKMLIKDAKRTMGPAKVELPSPNSFLLKHSQEPTLPKGKPCRRVVRPCKCKKPPVPLRTDQSHIRIYKDFIKAKKKHKPLPLIPPRSKPCHVDTNRGNKQVLENSGLVLKYIYKKDFGKVPLYLVQRHNKDTQKAQEYENFLREQKEKDVAKWLSEEARQTLLEGLKTSWDACHQQYLGLPFITDNVRKKVHKDELEQEMKQLETDIKLINTFKNIRVSDP